MHLASLTHSVIVSFSSLINIYNSSLISYTQQDVTEVLAWVPDVGCLAGFCASAKTGKSTGSAAFLVICRLSARLNVLKS